MANKPQAENEPENRKDSTAFSRTVHIKAERKLKAQRDSGQGVWLGLGMMGIVGWSVAVPTLLGAALGLWLDNRHVGTHSWTLALLMAGLSLGCFNAWGWVAKEDRAIREEQESDGE